MKDVLRLWAALDQQLPLEKKCQKNQEDQEMIKDDLAKWDSLIERFPADRANLLARKICMEKWLALLERYPSRTYNELQFEFSEEIEGSGS